MKTNEKLKNAFAAADEELFAAAENAAFTPSADFERRAAAIVRKKNGVTWRFVNTTGKKVAAAALALVIVAAAVFAIPAVRGMFGKNNVTEDANILYRSENGDITVRVVEPLDVSRRSDMTWAPITEEKLNSAAEVFIGTIETIDEVEITHEIMDLTVTSYRSLLTVSVDSIIKESGETAKGDTVSVVFGLSSRMVIDGGTLPEKGKQYAFFLRKTADKESELDQALSEVAEYTYMIAGVAFIPMDETQDPLLLKTIGAGDEIKGDEFINALRDYYEK